MENKDIVIYKTNEGQVKVIIHNESVWMNQEQIGELFGKDRTVISKHISNIYFDEELSMDNTSMLVGANVQNMHVGYNKQTRYFNLEIIFAVGYRVRGSEKAIAFRNWATSVLKEFSLRGFVMDDERLENGNTINGKKDFDEILKVNRLEVLQSAGKVSKEKMEKVVALEIKKYQERWGSLDIYIDTIKEVKRIENKKHS